MSVFVNVSLFLLIYIYHLFLCDLCRLIDTEYKTVSVKVVKSRGRKKYFFLLFLFVITVSPGSLQGLSFPLVVQNLNNTIKVFNKTINERSPIIGPRVNLIICRMSRIYYSWRESILFAVFKPMSSALCF